MYKFIVGFCFVVSAFAASDDEKGFSLRNHSKKPAIMTLSGNEIEISEDVHKVYSSLLGGPDFQNLKITQEGMILFDDLIAIDAYVTIFEDSTVNVYPRKRETYPDWLVETIVVRTPEEVLDNAIDLMTTEQGQYSCLHAVGMRFTVPLHPHCFPKSMTDTDFLALCKTRNPDIETTIDESLYVEAEEVLKEAGVPMIHYHHMLTEIADTHDT